MFAHRIYWRFVPSATWCWGSVYCVRFMRTSLCVHGVSGSTNGWVPVLLLISDRDVPFAAWAETINTVREYRVGTRGITLDCKVRGWLLLKISHASLLTLAREQSECLIMAAGLRVRGNGGWSSGGTVLAYLTRALLKTSRSPRDSIIRRIPVINLERTPR